jgi:hypothetical protein
MVFHPGGRVGLGVDVGFVEYVGVLIVGVTKGGVVVIVNEDVSLVGVVSVISGVEVEPVLTSVGVEHANNDKQSNNINPSSTNSIIRFIIVNINILSQIVKQYSLT